MGWVLERRPAFKTASVIVDVDVDVVDGGTGGEEPRRREGRGVRVHRGVTEFAEATGRGDGGTTIR